MFLSLLTGQIEIHPFSKQFQYLYSLSGPYGRRVGLVHILVDARHATFFSNKFKVINLKKNTVGRLKITHYITFTFHKYHYQSYVIRHLDHQTIFHKLNAQISAATVIESKQPFLVTLNHFQAYESP